MKSFIDLAQIEVKAGDGGDGLVSFRREKFVPKGGPDGGSGGSGGSVYVVANSQLTTLYDFTHQHKFVAEEGESGKKAQATGKSGDDLSLQVPVGTIIYELRDKDTSEAKLVKAADLSHDQDKVLVTKGGKGGRGNTTYKSSTNQTPRQFEYGTPGEHKHLVLELKVVADVGLIGLPNAGKSTLLSRLTAARPEIAEYPFTTLSPNLGAMEYYGKHIMLADIPGLIEGAAEGRGLGDDFLRHIERTRILVHLIDPFYEDPIKSYQTIRNELNEYSEQLLEKFEIVVINKIDVTEVNEQFESIKKQFKKEFKLDVLPISAATGKGLNDLQNQIAKVLENAKALKHQDAKMSDQSGEDTPIFTIQDVKHF